MFWCLAFCCEEGLPFGLVGKCHRPVLCIAQLCDERGPRVSCTAGSHPVSTPVGNIGGWVRAVFEQIIQSSALVTSKCTITRGSGHNVEEQSSRSIFATNLSVTLVRHLTSWGLNDFISQKRVISKPVSPPMSPGAIILPPV